MLGTVAAFFRWLKSTAEHLDEKTRWYVVLRCAFRMLLMPEPPLGAVIPTQQHLDGKLVRQRPASERKPVGRSLSRGKSRVGQEPN